MMFVNLSGPTLLIPFDSSDLKLCDIEGLLTHQSVPPLHISYFLLFPSTDQNSTHHLGEALACPTVYSEIDLCFNLVCSTHIC